MKSSVVIAQIVLLFGWFPAIGCGSDPVPTALKGPEAPGVLIFVVDTLRADHLGAYGYPLATSPNIDRLAAEGTLFESVVSQASFSGPSYATLLTGKLPQEHGVRDHPRVLSADNETLAEAARRGGVRTAGFVTHPFLTEKWNYDQGFDEYRFVGPRAGSALPGGIVEDAVTEAIDWLDDLEEEEPFLLFLQVMEPHMPYLPPAPFDTRFGKASVGYRLMADVEQVKGRHVEVMFSLPELGYGAADVERTIQLYDGSIAEVDEQIARLLARLEELGRLDRTLVIITADHGEMLGEKELYFHHDMALYDPVALVPLVMRLPGTVPAGRRVATQVRLSDLAPTVLDVLGLAGLPEIFGSSLRPLFESDGDHRVAFSENQPYQEERSRFARYRMEVPGIRGKWRMVRTGDAKLILIPTAEGVQEELYDLEADPDERENLLELRPDLHDRLRQLLRRHLAADPGFTGDVEDDPTLDSDAEEELRALGYLG